MPAGPSGARRRCSTSRMLSLREIAASPLERALERLRQRVDVDVLGEEARTAPARSAEQPDLVVVGAGQDHDHLVRDLLDDPARRGDAVELGHHDVHQDHVGAVVQRELDRLAPVVRLRDDDHAGALQRLLDHPPGEGIVVRDDRAHRRSPGSGSGSDCVWAPRASHASRSAARPGRSAVTPALTAGDLSHPLDERPGLTPRHHPGAPRARHGDPPARGERFPLSAAVFRREAAARDQAAVPERAPRAGSPISAALSPPTRRCRNLLGVLSAKLELCARLPVYEWEAGSEGHDDCAARVPHARADRA